MAVVGTAGRRTQFSTFSQQKTGGRGGRETLRLSPLDRWRGCADTCGRAKTAAPKADGTAADRANSRRCCKPGNTGWSGHGQSCPDDDKWCTGASPHRAARTPLPIAGRRRTVIPQNTGKKRPVGTEHERWEPLQQGHRGDKVEYTAGRHTVNGEKRAPRSISGQWTGGLVGR